MLVNQPKRKTGMSVYTELANKYNLPYQVIRVICNHPFLFASRKIAEADTKPLMFSYIGKVPTGQKDECTIILRDASSQIETPTTVYKLTDELYIYLQLLANKVTANLYKLAEDDTTIQQ